MCDASLANPASACFATRTLCLFLNRYIRNTATGREDLERLPMLYAVLPPTGLTNGPPRSPNDQIRAARLQASQLRRDKRSRGGHYFGRRESSRLCLSA